MTAGAPAQDREPIAAAAAATLSIDLRNDFIFYSSLDA
jgi:hypothetical protein